MHFVTKLKSGSATHTLDLDLSHVNMTAEQRTIASKLFDKAKNEVIDVNAKDPCTEGKCLASKLLTPGEFEQVRGLKAQLGGHISSEWIIIDFCIHPINHKLNFEEPAST